MIMIASARQPRSWEPRGERESSETKTPAPSVYAKHSPPGTPASQCLARLGSGHRVMSPHLPGAPPRRGFPPHPSTQRGREASGTEGGGGC